MEVWRRGGVEVCGVGEVLVGRRMGGCNTRSPASLMG